MTTLQKGFLLGAFVVASGVALYETTVIRAQGAMLRAIYERADALRADIREVRTARNTTAGSLAGIEQQIDARLATLRMTSPDDAALETKAREWLEEFGRLKETLAQHPRLNIPELQLLAEDEWFNIASAAPLKSNEDIRRAMSRLRDRAEGRAAEGLSRALKAYLTAHDNELPASPQELASFCRPPLAPAIIARYEMLRTGKAPEAPSDKPLFATDRIVMAPKEPADLELDRYWLIGPSNYEGLTTALDYNLRFAQNGYAKASGKFTIDVQELQPYVKWPLSHESLRNLPPPFRR